MDNYLLFSNKCNSHKVYIKQFTVKQGILRLFKMTT